jgi:NAD(P)H-hydrate repair Nnr-like enzyme with NAD(P)H-hydrate dehydratase domain
MGDVLTGVLAAVIAQGLHHHLSVFEATCLSVDIHSGAADALVNQGVGPIGLTPSEIIHQIRDLINFK